jgi:hypothetical protein
VRPGERRFALRRAIGSMGLFRAMTACACREVGHESGTHNDQAQPQWAHGKTVFHSNVDATTEQSKTVEPIVG